MCVFGVGVARRYREARPSVAFRPRLSVVGLNSVTEGASADRVSIRKSLCALIVEDSPNDAELLVCNLEQAGYSVVYERVQTADAMSAALERRPWDVVLSDYSMPSFSATAALAVLQQSGRDLPFIIISGTIGEDAAVTALKAGAHDFLVKGRLARLVPAIERERRDVADRHRRRHAEEALRASEAQYPIARRTRGLWDLPGHG